MSTMSADVREAVERVEALLEELPSAPWYVATNKHPTTDGRPWGALELVPHPAGGAGKALYTWTGAEARNIAKALVSLRNDLPEVLDTLTEHLERLEREKEDLAEQLHFHQENMLDGASVARVIDRAEAAEARIRELEQELGQRESRARKREDAHPAEGPGF